MKLKLIILAAVTMLFSQVAVAMPADVVEAQKADGKVPYYVSERELHSTNMTTAGVLPQVTNTEDEAFAKKINDEISDFFNMVCQEGLKGGMPYPRCDFSYEQFWSDKYLSIVVRGMITRPEKNMDEFVYTVVLDSYKYDKVSLTDILGANGIEVANQLINDQIQQNKAGFKENVGVNANDSTSFFVTKDNNLEIVFDRGTLAEPFAGTPSFEITLDGQQTMKLGLSADDYYVENGVVMVPYRKIAENFGYTVTWDGTSAHITDAKVDATVTPKVDNYNGKQLGAAPVNKNGSIHVPVQFMREVLGLSFDQHDNEITFAQLVPTEASIRFGRNPGIQLMDEVRGTVSDATMNTLTIASVDGKTYTFTGEDARVTNIDTGIMLNLFVSVKYEGTLNGTDTSGVTKYTVNNFSGRNDVKTIKGTIVDASMNTVKIKALDGTEYQFSTVEADKTSAGGLAVGSDVYVDFMGDYSAADASKAEVTRVYAVK